MQSPREGMQGFSRIIPTREKVRYINQLLRAGFDTVEAGSIASARLIPQMADSLEVLGSLDFSGTNTNLMFLALNTRGAEILAEQEKVTHISYPFSFSPTFLKRNVNATVDQSLDTAETIIRLCREKKKQAVIYLSMAYGNPYGDPWSIDLLVKWIGKLHKAGATIIPLSNVSMEIDATMITRVFSTLVPMFPGVEFGLHLHTANHGWYEKVDAARRAGCRRFDGVINGWGGCPMTGEGMLGNLKTENLLEYAATNQIRLNMVPEALQKSFQLAGEIFN